MRRAASVRAVAVLALGLLAACGTVTVDSAELEEQVSTQISAEVGQTPESVDCPDELTGEVGATTTCVLTASDGSTIDATVEVSAVDGNRVSFTIEVADEVN